MSDVKKQRAYIKTANGRSKDHIVSLRIALNSPFGTAVILLKYPEEAVSWDSAL